MKNFEDAKNVMRDYFLTILPDAYLEEIIRGEDEMREEVETGGVYDTFSRDLLIDLVCKDLGVSLWPTYGDTQEYKENFLNDYMKRVEEVGGTFIVD